MNMLCIISNWKKQLLICITWNLLIHVTSQIAAFIFINYTRATKHEKLDISPTRPATMQCFYFQSNEMKYTCIICMFIFHF